MPVDAAHIKEITQLINAAKQEPVNFGLCLGAKPDTDTLLMHRTKAGKPLSMDAKTKAKGTKVAFGIASVAGTTLSLTCEEKPPTGLAKRTKAMLLEMKLHLKVRLVGADGEVYEDDGEEAPAQGGAEARSGTPAAPEATAAKPPPAPPSAAPPPPPKAEAAPDTAALAKLLATLAARIPAAAGADEARRAALLKLATQANVYLKTNNPNYAANTIEELRGELEGGSPAPPAPPPASPSAPDAAALAKQLAALIPRVAGVADPARKAELAKLAQMSNVNLKTNNLKTAAASIAELAGALDRQSPAVEDQNAAELLAARKVWVAARGKVEGDVTALQDAVVGAYASRGLGPKLTKAYQDEVAWVLRALDERVAAALDTLLANGSGGRHAALVDEAHESVADYQTFLSTDPIIAGLDRNPFGVPLSIRATLSPPLAALAKAVA